MSDILSSYFSLNSKKRDYKLDLKDTPNLNKICYEHGLKFSGNSKTLKLPKLKIMSKLIAERNKSSEGFKVNKKNEISTPKPNNKNNKHFSMRYKKVNGYKQISNNIFKNKLLSGLNKSTRSYTKNIYSSSPISNKNKENNLYVFKDKNKNDKDNDITIKINENDGNNNGEETDINKDKLRREDKRIIVEEYVNTLLSEDIDSKRVLFDSLNDEQKKEDKFKLEKSIDPTKYIKNNFLDETFNHNNFTTTKIQIDCFNGNEQLRNENIKKINENNKNSLKLDLLKTESNNIRTKSLIDKMFPKQLTNFHFGKKVYGPRVFNIKSNNNINLKNSLESNDMLLTLDEKLKSVILGTKEMEKDFKDHHKSRRKIIRKIREFCDNYDGIIKKASVINIKIKQ